MNKNKGDLSLKSCPFCNAEATIWQQSDPYAEHGVSYIVECNNEKCGCSYGNNMSLDFEQVIKMWNKRPKENK